MASAYFLLNIGPRAEGSIPQKSIDRLEAVGRWMDVNGEAIHATQAGPFPRRLSWGQVTRKASEHGGTTLDLHVWDWPADGRILLPACSASPKPSRHLCILPARPEFPVNFRLGKNRP